MFLRYAAGLLAGSMFAIVATAVGAEGVPAAERTTSELREAVVGAETSREKAKAYKAYFLRIGSDGLKDAMQDGDDGIALQAAWEVHTIPARRNEQNGPRTNDIYDPVELAKFVAFFEERTKAPVPDRWATSMTDVDLFPGMHHAFIGPQNELRKVQNDGDERSKVRFEKKGPSLVCTAGDRSIEISRKTFRSAGESFVGLFAQNRWIVAGYPDAGFAFRTAAFESDRPEPAWTADVWGAGRSIMAGQGYHYVDLTEKDGVVYLFGMESHGAYAEAFDAKTGKVRFRFCTCYWFDHSEEWGLK